MIEETYQNFEGMIIGGEKVPTKDMVRSMPNKEFKKANPFVKKNCSDCSSLHAAMSLWCTNEKAVEARGTTIPGVSFCPFWTPNWSYIPEKYKRPEYGYVSRIESVKRKSLDLIGRIKALLNITK